MERILINQISENDGKKVLIKGRVLNMRNLSNVVFLIIQDYTGTIQTVFEKAVEVKTGDAVAIEGLVKKEPRSKYGFEISGDNVEVIAAQTTLASARDTYVSALTQYHVARLNLFFALGQTGSFNLQNTGQEKE